MAMRNRTNKSSRSTASETVPKRPASGKVGLHVGSFAGSNRGRDLLCSYSQNSTSPQVVHIVQFGPSRSEYPDFRKVDAQMRSFGRS